MRFLLRRDVRGDDGVVVQGPPGDAIVAIDKFAGAVNGREVPIHSICCDGLADEDDENGCQQGSDFHDDGGYCFYVHYRAIASMVNATVARGSIQQFPRATYPSGFS